VFSFVRLPYRPCFIHFLSAIVSRIFLKNWCEWKTAWGENEIGGCWREWRENVYSGFNFNQTTDKIVQFLIDWGRAEGGGLLNIWCWIKFLKFIRNSFDSNFFNFWGEFGEFVLRWILNTVNLNDAWFLGQLTYKIESCWKI
jgi:hypothetical protein